MSLYSLRGGTGDVQAPMLKLGTSWALVEGGVLLIALVLVVVA